MGNEMGKHFYVSGNVQGVWYRANTQKVANNLAIKGWVRNLPDGRVEVMAYGLKESIERLEAWLHLGPPRAEVTSVTAEDAPWEACEGFRIV